MNKPRSLALTMLLLSSAASGSPPKYDIGRPLSTAEETVRSISVAPEGTGAPVGRGTAIEGRQTYMTKCASCHGVKGEGDGADSPPLVGGRGTLNSERPMVTIGSYWPYATTIFDYIRRAMPYQDAGTLSDNEVYAVTAYLLFANSIIGEKDVMDRRSLAAVRMPNRDGFVADPRPDVGSKPPR